MPNRFVPIGAGTDFGQAIASINANFAQLDSEAVTKVFNQANGKNGQIIGKLPNDLGYGTILYDADGNASLYMSMTPSGPVFKIAKDGYDATTTSDDNLIFNSAQNVFKIVVSNTSTVTNSATSTTTTTIPHNLGFIPIPVVFISFSGSYYQLPTPTSYSRDDTNHVIKLVDWVSARTNSTNLYIDWANSASSAQWSGSLTIKYYLLQETAN